MSDSQITLSGQEAAWFWKEVGDDVGQALTPEQKQAIENAVRRTQAGAQPGDIRLSFGTFFVRIIAGKERRSRERLQQTRAAHPVFIAKNLPLLVVFWTVTFLSSFYAVGFAISALARFVF